MFTCTNYIYYCYAKQLDVLWQISHVKYSSGYTYNWVSCKISTKIVIPYNMYVFLILPFILLWYLTYINPLLSTYFYIIFYVMVYVCMLYIYSDVLYMLCTLDIYTWDIYINIKLYCTIHFTSSSYCHSKSHTQLHWFYMSWNESIWHM